MELCLEIELSKKNAFINNVTNANESLGKIFSHHHGYQADDTNCMFYWQDLKICLNEIVLMITIANDMMMPFYMVSVGLENDISYYGDYKFSHFDLGTETHVTFALV